jgi:hypothetical protein
VYDQQSIIYITIDISCCFAEPVLTAQVSENEDATTTDTVALTYGDENQDGVFDNYVFTIDVSSQQQVVKPFSDTARNVLFSGLTAGTQYTISAKVFSNNIPSSSATTLQVTTRKY